MPHILTPVSQGPQPTPRSIPFTLGPVVGTPFTYVGLPRTWAPSSAIDGVVHGDGVSRIRHITKGMPLPTGLLAPAVPPIVETEGRHNERVLDFTDALFRVTGGASSYLQVDIGGYILARVSLSATVGAPGALYEVLYDNDPAVVVERFGDMVNGVNKGVTWEAPDNTALWAGWEPLTAVQEGLTLRLISKDYHQWMDGITLTEEGSRPFMGVTLGPDIPAAAPSALQDGRFAFIEWSTGNSNPATTQQLTVRDSAGLNIIATIEFNAVLPGATGNNYHVLVGSDFKATMMNMAQLFGRAHGETSQYLLTDPTLVGDPLAEYSMYYVSTNKIFLVCNRAQSAPPLTAVHPFTWTPASPAAFGGGLDPDGDLMDPGTYRWATGAYRSFDQAQSAQGELSEPLTHGGEPVEVTAQDLSPDPAVDYFDVWRTLVGGLGGDTFLVEHAPVNVNPYVDLKNDDEIGAVASVPYNSREFRTRRAGYPPAWRNLISFDRSVWGCGGSRAAPQVFKADITKGARKFTPKAPVVPTNLWTGRVVVEESIPVEYLVVFVDETTGEVELDRPWEGDTTVDADLICEDTRRPHGVGKSEPRKPNQWPVVREWAGIQSEHPDGVTACAKARESFFAWTREGIWRLSGSAPGEYILREVADGVGCAAHRTLIVHDGVAFWFEGPQGFYAWSFGSVDVQGESGAPQRISNPPWVNEGDPFGIQDTVDRVNMDALEWAFAHVDPDGRIIRWFLPADGSEVPNIIVTYDLKTGTWSTNDCPGATSACSVLGPEGDWVTIVGDVEGNIWQLDTGLSNGVYEYEPFHTLTGATDDTLTVTGETFPSGLEGAQVLVIHEDGELEKAVVAGTSGDTIALREALRRTPLAGAYIVLGAIHWELEPNRFHFGTIDETKKVTHLWIAFSPRTGAQGHLFVGVEDDALGAPMWDSPEIDLGHEHGVERPNVALTGFEMTYRLFGFMPGEGPVLRRIEANARIRQKPQVSQ